QVLATPRVPSWRVLAWVKAIEAIVQLRPKAIWRTLAGRDRAFRHGMRWYAKIGRRVWLHEICEFLLGTPISRNGPTLREFWGGSRHREEKALSRTKKVSASHEPELISNP